MRAVILALAALLSLVAFLPAQPAAERKAAKEFMRAENLIRQGKYGPAVALYKQIVKRYKNTGAGLLALGRSQDTAYLGQADIARHGESSNRIDIIIMGDGYRLQDQNEFDDVAKAIPKLFKKHKLLGEYYSYHNFIRANLRSKDQGVTGFGRKKDTALGGFIAGKVQGQVGVNGGKVRAMLNNLDEHDSLSICIVKAGSAGTGGAGIAAIGGRADDVLIHEWGHAFGDLADEYSTFTGHRGRARNSVNISISKDPAKAPWRHFLAKKYPGVGLYRGGDGRIKGVWRPTASGCAMQGGVTFCPVCREALILKMYRYVDPVDDYSPDPKKIKSKRNGVDQPILVKNPKFFEVRLMKPKTHALQARWWILSSQDAIKPTAVGPFKDRRRRGKLQEITKKPMKTNEGGSPRSRLKVIPRDLEPGRYQVVCRVKDRTRPSGQARPWVLADDQQLLESERCWWIEVKR